MESNETLEQATNEMTTQEQENVSAENQNNEVKSEPIDYSKLSEVEIINALRDLLQNDPKDVVPHEVEHLRSAFYIKHNAQVESERAAFLAEEGDIKDFQSSNAPYAKDIKDLLSIYRQQRAEQAKKMEQEREDNLAQKYAVIEQIKLLIEKEESMNNTFNEFNELQKQWREIGSVPQASLQDLWDSYHHNVEKFYDFIHINNELRDLDFQRNLDAKKDLCLQAESLAEEGNVDKARADLQSFHEQWREIGPVPREEREQLWLRFKAASSFVNRRHQEFYMKRKEEELENLASKTALCEKIESLCETIIETRKQWDEYVAQVKEIQVEWRKIGYTPKKDNAVIYTRFCAACDAFFDKRREFYNQQKEEQRKNLQLKEELCEKAEALQDSEDWKKTTDALIELQNQWKKIGQAPRKQTDAVWSRFRAACDFFFENKAQKSSSSDSEQMENLKKKSDLIEELKAYQYGENEEQTFIDLKAFQQRWSEIGHVPFKQKDELFRKFRKSLNACYDKLKISTKERNTINFRNKIEELSDSKSFDKIRQERERIMTKIKFLEKDLITLENNISFFSDSSNPLVAEVKRKIEQTRLDLTAQQENLKVLRDLKN
ncbi:MAG: DUF349 domain-containing protein [Mangrovibacterium sp.]